MQAGRQCAFALMGAVLAALQSAAGFAQTVVAGSTTLAAQVTETGAAVLSIPIQVPPGTAAIQPALALVYNSQAGNGHLGMGWSLQGLPAIERCPKTIAQDGVRTAVQYDAADRYCMGGQRLVSINGPYGAPSSEYRTERETFSRFIANGAAGSGPASFTAWTRSGQVMEFGNSPSSSVEALGKASVRVYALNRVSDYSNNFLLVSYAEDGTGDHRPTEIQYTGNSAIGLAPDARVVFVYQGRPDVIIRNIAGSDVRIGTRISNIQTFVGATMVRDYRIEYEQGLYTGRSRITSLTECSGDGAICFPPLTFSYSDETFSKCFLCAAAWTGGHGTGSNGWALADLFGDGTMVYHTQTDGTHFATRLGFSKGGVLGQTPTAQNWTWAGAHGVGNLGRGFGDLFGDGRTLYYSHNRDGTHFATRLNPDGTVQNWAWTGGHGIGAPSTSCGGGFFSEFCRTIAEIGNWRLADLFGDGRRIYYTRSWDGNHFATRLNPDGTLQNWHWAGGNGEGDSGWDVGDLFGDGRRIYYTHNMNGQHFATRLNEDGTLQNWSWAGGHGVGSQGWRLVDLFGDGRDVYYTIHGDGNHHATRLNPDGTLQNWTWTGGHGIANGGWDLVDLHGDGRKVYVTHSTDGTKFATRLNPDGTLVNWSWNDSTGIGDAGWGWADLFGTGRSVYFTHSNDGTHYAASRMELYATAFDLIVSAVPSLGGQVAFTYAPLSDSTVHAKDAGAAWPSLDLHNALWVVRVSSQREHASGAVDVVYRYVGAKANLAGGGFLGFRQIASANGNTGITTTTNFRQDYPFARLATSLVSTQPSGGLLKQVTNTWTDTLFPASAGGRHHRADLTGSVESGNDLDGVAWPTVTTGTTYDGFGNPLTITTGTGDGNSRTTTNTFSSIVTPTRWLPGLLIRSSVASTKP